MARSGKTKRPPPEQGERPPASEKRHKRKWGTLGWTVYWFLFIALWLLFEYFDSNLLRSLTLTGVSLWILKTVFASIKDRDKKPDRRRTPGMPLWYDLFELVRQVFREIRSSTRRAFSLAVAGLVVGAVFLSHIHAAGRLLLATEGAFSVIKEHALAAQPSPSLTSSSEEESRPDPTQVKTDSATSDPKTFLRDPRRFTSLSESEWRQLLFRREDGSDMSDEEVCERWQAIEAARRLDELREDSPEEWKAMADDASRREAAMTDSDDLDRVIGSRLQLLAHCPSAKLWDLLAENYHRYALAYILEDGNRETIFYYYGQSILALQQEREYAHAAVTCERRILQRYRDMLSRFRSYESSDIRDRLQHLIALLEQQGSVM